jgi:hypothetical protein
MHFKQFVNWLLDRGNFLCSFRHLLQSPDQKNFTSWGVYGGTKEMIRYSSLTGK